MFPNLKIVDPFEESRESKKRDREDISFSLGDVVGLSDAPEEEWVVLDACVRNGRNFFDLRRKQSRQVAHFSLKKMSDKKAVSLDPRDEDLVEGQELLYFKEGVCHLVELGKIYRDGKEFYFDVFIKMVDVPETKLQKKKN